MAKTLEDLDRLRPIDPAALADATEALLLREQAWQLRDLITPGTAEITRRQ